jgi:CheY-like chemotaxis protein
VVIYLDEVRASMAEKILIVDDDPETIEFLTLILTRSG